MTERNAAATGERGRRKRNNTLKRGEEGEEGCVRFHQSEMERGKDAVPRAR